MATEFFPVVQWFNRSGAVLSGGKIFSYAAGTSTPLATYTDSTGTTPNANPLILDASGSGQIWFGASSYKLVVQDASNVQQYSIDNITLDNLAATIASLLCTGAITMQQPTAATNSANQSSNSLSLQGTYWNGSSSATDQWTIQDIVGTGTNPTSTLTFSHSGSSGAASVSLGSIALSAGTFQGAWGKGNTGSPYILQLVDGGTLNNQLIGFNVEQQNNPASDSSVLSFGQATELFTPSANVKNFTGGQIGVYGSFSHFGSGSLTSGGGADFEGFNSGPATATLVTGVTATANNGGVSAGVPAQTPSNNGISTNLRAVDAVVKNLSSGAVTNASAFYAESAIKTGAGAITNAYGLFVADQTIATNNFAIKTGLGKVEFGDNVQCDSTVNLNGLVGQSGGTSSAAGIFLQATPSTGLSGTTQIGVRIATSTGSDATAEGSALWARCDTPNVSFTQTLNTGIHVFTPTKGAASTITEWNGIKIEAGPTAGSTFGIKQVGTDALFFGGKITTYNNVATAGEGLTSVRASTLQRSESGADANVLTLTPPAIAGMYRLTFVLDLSAANAATLGWTATWKESNGLAKAPTNLPLTQNGTAAPALTFTTSATDTFSGSYNINIDNSATNIVIKLTFSGTSFTGKVTANIERIS